MSTTTVSATYTRTMLLFAKHVDSDDVCVCIQTRAEVEGFPVMVTTGDQYVTDQVLQGLAEAKGKSTWDETEIRDHFNLSLPAPAEEVPDATS